MSDDTKRNERPAETGDEQDVEGHSLYINPGMSRDLATSRSRDVEREARDRQLKKETRGR